MSQMKLRKRSQIHLPDYLKPPENLKSRSSARLRNRAKPAVFQPPIVKKRKIQRHQSKKQLVIFDSDSTEGKDQENYGETENDSKSEELKPEEEKVATEVKLEESKFPPEYDHYKTLLRRKINITSGNDPSPHSISREMKNATTVGAMKNENRLLIKPIIQENRSLVKPIMQQPINKIPAISCPICFECFTTSNNEVLLENHLRVFHVKFWMEQTGERILPLPLRPLKDLKILEKEKKKIDIDSDDDYLPNCNLGPCKTCAARGLRCGFAPVCIRVVMRR